MRASEYLSEVVNYGGEEMPRGEMIADLRRNALVQTDGDKRRASLIVDRYLQGFERGREARARYEATS